MILFSKGRHKLPAIGLLAVVLGLFAPALAAQHSGHMEMTVMTSALFPGLPMAREGSGTSWQPDSTPVFAWHATLGSWSFMIHGGAFLRYTSQDAGRAGKRGDRMVDAPNWVMVMAQPGAAKRGGFTFRGMFSFDRWTEGGTAIRSCSRPVKPGKANPWSIGSIPMTWSPNCRSLMAGR